MKKALDVTKIIDNTYEGGTDKFLKDRGALCYIPEPTDLMYITHPNLPSKLRKELDDKYEGTIIYGSRWNFEGASEEDLNSIRTSIENSLSVLVLGSSLGVTVNPCVAGITLPDLNKEDPLVELICKGFSDISGLERGCIICKNGYKTFEGVPSAVSTIQSIKIETPKRDTPINQDDILNLTIALESCRTMEEFLSLV